MIVAQGLMLSQRDNVYGVDLKSGKLSAPILIDRCSENFAISVCGKHKFNRKIDMNGKVVKVSDTKDLSNNAYYIETPQIVETYERQMLIYDITNFNYNNLSTSWLREIKDSLKRRPNK